jgi:hypothetical protein
MLSYLPKPIKKFLKLFIPLRLLHEHGRKVACERIYAQWEKDGRPIPAPDAVKQRIVTAFARKYQTRVLVETGTFMGDMIFAQRKNFKHIHTIELSEEYFRKAKKKFEKDPHIKIYQGDSPVVLRMIMPMIKERALFWLDAHYSVDVFARGNSDCPLFAELDVLFAHNNKEHIILIDDARDFTGRGDYPTVEAVIEYFKQKAPSYQVKVEHDIFCCIPD